MSVSVREIEFFFRETVKDICSKAHVQVIQPMKWCKFALRRTPGINPNHPLLKLAQHDVPFYRIPAFIKQKLMNKALIIRRFCNTFCNKRCIA